MTHIDNETLVAECGAGNREAMDIFYKRFAPRMLRLIGRYVSEVTRMPRISFMTDLLWLLPISTR